VHGFSRAADDCNESALAAGFFKQAFSQNASAV